MKSRPIAVNPDPENCEPPQVELLLVAIEGFCQLQKVALLRFRCANLLSWILVFSAFAAFHGAFGVEFSTASVAGKKVTICRVDLAKERLQLFHRDETGMPFKRFNRLAAWLQARDQKLVFAMNAGMYHPDFSAVGLFISEGKQLAPLNLAAGKGNFFLTQRRLRRHRKRSLCCGIL